MTIQQVAIAAVLLLVAALGLLKAGEHKGRKKEKLEGAEETFAEEQAHADTVLQKELAQSPLDRVLAALFRANSRRDKRDS